MTRLELDLAVNPLPLGRPRFTTFGRGGRPITHTPQRSIDFAEEFRYALLAAGVRHPIEDPYLSLDIALWRRCRGIGARQRGDLDNHVKAILDAGNGFLWEDDSQIVDLRARFLGAGPDVDGRIKLIVSVPAGWSLRNLSEVSS